MREGGDRGTPIAAADPDAEAAQAIAGIADALPGTRRARMPLPILQRPERHAGPPSC